MRHRAAHTVAHGRPLAEVQASEQGLRAVFSPQDGAELAGLQVRDGAEWVELLYRGCDWSPVAGWRGRAPWLWPMAGRAYAELPLDRSGVDRDRCTWRDGDTIREMPHHGFARLHPWRSEGVFASDTVAAFRARLDTVAGEAARYPFRYRLAVVAEVAASQLTVRFEVEADGANTGPMPFNLGLHLTFDLAAWWGPRWFEGTVGGLGTVAWGADRLSQPADAAALPTTPIALCDPRLENALIAAGPSPRVVLRSPDARRSLTLAHKCTGGFTTDQPLWVTHMDPQRRFFCVEPWVGWPNALNNGRGVVRVAPGERWSWTLQLGVSAPAGHAPPFPGGAETAVGALPTVP